MKSLLTILVFLALPAVVVAITACAIVVSLALLCVGLADGFSDGLTIGQPYRKMLNTRD